MSKKLTPGFYPFWFWNDALDESEVRWQIQAMAEQGIKGFYIHPRQGLATPYMSDAFFAMVEAAVDEAKKLGMTVQLYDEYPYPSGVAGGEVLLGNPQYFATRLVQRKYDLPGGDVRLELPAGKILSCIAYPLDGDEVVWDQGMDLGSAVGVVLAHESYVETGLTQYNRKRYFASDPTPVLQTRLPDRPHRLYVGAQALVEGHKYWNHFIDALNPEAVQAFIRLTHERYRERFGDDFGSAIGSIFVDETEPGWSDRIPEAFLKAYGYDLLPLLPALQEPSHPRHEQVKLDLHRLRLDLFIEAFEKPVGRWCQEHGIRYAGEKPSLRFSQLQYMDIPGCDPGHTKAGAKMDILRPPLRSNARAVASAAYFYDKPGSLCECYHSLGWSGTLQDAKLIAEGLLLMGIDWLVPHGFFYTTHALKKHDAPPSFFFQMPYWPMFGRLSQRVDRIAERFAGTRIDARLLVVDPTGGLPSRQQQASYGRLLDLLMEARLDFLIVDTDILESGTAQSASDGAARLRVADVDANAVVLPPMSVVEPALAQWLDAFEAQGGRVVRVASDFDADNLRQDLFAIAPPLLDLQVVEGDGRGLQVVTRQGDGVRRWFLVNTMRERLEVEINSEAALTEAGLDPDLPPLLEFVDGRYRRQIAPFESVLLEETSAAQRPAERRAPKRLPIRFNQEVSVKTLHPNLARLYYWDMEISGADGTSYGSGRVKAVPLANQLTDAGLPFPPAFDHFFGQPPRMRLPQLTAAYRTEFHWEHDGEALLVMEPDSIGGEWRIRVNDSEPVDASALAPVEAHVRGSVGLAITEHLRPGRNKIEVIVQTDRSDGGLRNPLYLAGDFSVHLNPLRLSAPKTSGRFEDWEGNGLPFYAGIVEYASAFELTADEIDAAFAHGPALAEIEVDFPFDEACEISINSGPWQTLPWSPRLLKIDRDDMRVGHNDIAVRVYTSLIRSFEGQRFDIPSHAYQEIEGTR